MNIRKQLYDPMSITCISTECAHKDTCASHVSGKTRDSTCYKLDAALLC